VRRPLNINAALIIGAIRRGLWWALWPLFGAPTALRARVGHAGGLQRIAHRADRCPVERLTGVDTGGQLPLSFVGKAEDLSRNGHGDLVALHRIRDTLIGKQQEAIAHTLTRNM